MGQGISFRGGEGVKMGEQLGYTLTATDNTAIWYDWNTAQTSTYPTIWAASSQEETKMRGLFVGYVVDPEMDNVVFSTTLPFVAKDEQSAKFKLVQMAGVLIEEDLDDYDIVVFKLGSVRPKKEIQEVKVVGK